MKKPAELVEPDPRWQILVGHRADLEEISGRWPVGDAVPQNIAEMLRVARALFAHSYFVYEFSVVAVIWSLLAVEAALRDRLGSSGGRRLAQLIADARERGLLTTGEAEALDAARELRNRYVHAETQGQFSPGLAGGMLEASHRAISDLYDRRA